MNVRLESVWDDQVIGIIGNFCPNCHLMYSKEVVECEVCPDWKEENFEKEFLSETVPNEKKD
jgi:hypothetical protein